MLREGRVSGPRQSFSPGFWKLVNPAILLPILLAELSLALWLLLKGITVEAK